MSNRQLAPERTPYHQPAALRGQFPDALTPARRLELVSHAEPMREFRSEVADKDRETARSGRSSASQSSWSVTLGHVMEGFLLYGASLHPNAAFPAGLLRGDHGGASAMDASAPRRFDVRLGHDTALPIPGSGTASGLAGRIARALRGSVAGLWARWRRERAIRKTVAALAELDDRTLYDMGIPSRHQIEEIIRYCRDC